MSWNCCDFDPSDKLAHIYLKYQGEYYDKGTIVKLVGREGPILARWTGWNFKDKYCFELLNHLDRANLYNHYDRCNTNKYIVEIVAPVIPNLQLTEEVNCKGFGLPDRDKPPSWDVEVAWIWYIVIMAVAVIFKDRMMIWAFVSAVFFLWKNGFLNNKK